MTQAKKLKKIIRARAKKTGESYTAARLQVLKRRAAPPPPKAKATAKPTARPRATSPTRGAISNAAILKKTGHGLDHWFAVLDAFGSGAKGHTDRAQYLYDVHGVPAWYTQGVTVAYERARGLRVMNQSCTGRFQVTVSRAVAASLDEVVDALGNAKRRAVWLRSADPALRAAMEAAFTGEKPRSVKVKNPQNASLRIKWDGSTVEIRIAGKPKGGSTTVAADNMDLPDASLVEPRREKWKVALEALKSHLTA